MFIIRGIEISLDYLCIHSFKLLRLPIKLFVFQWSFLLTIIFFDYCFKTMCRNRPLSKLASVPANDNQQQQQRLLTLTQLETSVQEEYSK